MEHKKVYTLQVKQDGDKGYRYQPNYNDYYDYSCADCRYYGHVMQKNMCKRAGECPHAVPYFNQGACAYGNALTLVLRGPLSVSCRGICNNHVYGIWDEPRFGWLKRRVLARFGFVRVR